MSLDRVAKARQSHGGASSPGKGDVFTFHPERPRLLLIGAEAGIGPTIALAEGLQEDMASSSPVWKPLVLLGSDQAFPFRIRPSSIIVAGIPAAVIACMPLIEEWGIPCRLASQADLPGCFEGPVTMLADTWLATLGPDELNEVEIFTCGSTTLRSETDAIAERYGVPCQTAP
jgi:dihydroorotate dehydrogenase electron transfer subunit